MARKFLMLKAPCKQEPIFLSPSSAQRAPEIAGAIGYRYDIGQDEWQEVVYSPEFGWEQFAILEKLKRARFWAIRNSESR